MANCAIKESFCYNKATPSFHQWRDIIDEKVYGVKFANIDDAKSFGDIVEKTVHSLEKMVRLIEDQTIYTMTGSVLEQPSSNHLNRNGFHNGIEQYQNDSINEQIDGQITKPHCSDFEFGTYF